MCGVGIGRISVIVVETKTGEAQDRLESEASQPHGLTEKPLR
jgi:hypothetical protein